MGIQDRDYMKRPSGRGGRRSGGGSLEDLAGSLLGRHRRWLIGLVVVIGLLIVVGLIIALMGS